MKTTRTPFLLFAFTLCLPISRAQESQTNLQIPPGMPSISTALTKIMKSMDFIDGEVLKVYSAEDQGAKYLAYVVKYKGNEVVVSDLIHTTSPKQPGDKITFIVQRMELPSISGEKNSVLQFTALK